MNAVQSEPNIVVLLIFVFMLWFLLLFLSGAFVYSFFFFSSSHFCYLVSEMIVLFFRSSSRNNSRDNFVSISVWKTMTDAFSFHRWNKTTASSDEWCIKHSNSIQLDGIKWNEAHNGFPWKSSKTQAKICILWVCMDTKKYSQQNKRTKERTNECTNKNNVPLNKE